MPKKRLTNSELVAEFRHQLTHGFVDAMPPEIKNNPEAKAAGIEATKPWRATLWQHFHEIADRLDPLGEEQRRKGSKK